MTNTQRLGITFLVAGSLTVVAAFLVWMAPLFFVPPPPTTTAVYDFSVSPFSAPALAPFIPPVPSVSTDKPVFNLASAGTSAPITIADDLSHRPISSEESNLSYSGAKEPVAQDEVFADSSLRLSIPALSIDAPVLTVGLESYQSGSRRPYQQWSVPDSYAVGWHDTSAPPGQAGNTVINGHNNIYGSVFNNLVDLGLGEQIILYKADTKYVYQVVHREFLPEKGEPLRTRLWNARWIAPSDDMRLTIVTCWPNSSNSHRLVVVAQAQAAEPDF